MIRLSQNISSNTIRVAVVRYIGRSTILSAHDLNLVNYCVINTIKLFKKMHNDGAILYPTLNDYKTEFEKLTDIHESASVIYTNFLDLGGHTGHRLTGYNTPVIVINPSNGENAEFQKRHVILIECLLYTTNCELILRWVKKFINFQLINGMLAHPSRQTMNSYARSNTLSPNQITLRPALNVLKRRYNTYLFQDIDCDLRNKISHYDFKFLNGPAKDGIYFNNNPANLREKKIYSDERLSKLNRKISLLYAALIHTNYGMLFRWNGIN